MNSFMDVADKCDQHLLKLTNYDDRDIEIIL